jgi:hypothetical protein
VWEDFPTIATAWYPKSRVYRTKLPKARHETAVEVCEFHAERVTVVPTLVHGRSDFRIVTTAVWSDESTTVIKTTFSTQTTEVEHPDGETSVLVAAEGSTPVALHASHVRTLHSGGPGPHSPKS